MNPAFEQKNDVVDMQEEVLQKETRVWDVAKQNCPR